MHCIYPAQGWVNGEDEFLSTFMPLGSPVCFCRCLLYCLSIFLHVCLFLSLLPVCLHACLPLNILPFCLLCYLSNLHACLSYYKSTCLFSCTWLPPWLPVCLNFACLFTFYLPATMLVTLSTWLPVCYVTCLRPCFFSIFIYPAAFYLLHICLYACL